jgi:hypothetical protein
MNSSLRNLQFKYVRAVHCPLLFPFTKKHPSSSTVPVKKRRPSSYPLLLLINYSSECKNTPAVECTGQLDMEQSITFLDRHELTGQTRMTKPSGIKVLHPHSGTIMESEIRIKKIFDG